MSDDQQPPEGPKLDLSKMSREDLEALFLRLEEVDRSRANLGIHFIGDSQRISSSSAKATRRSTICSELRKARAHSVGTRQSRSRWRRRDLALGQSRRAFSSGFATARMQFPAMATREAGQPGRVARKNPRRAWRRRWIVSQFLTVEDETDKRFGAVLRKFSRHARPKRATPTKPNPSIWRL